VGGYETSTPVLEEPSLKYHPGHVLVLTLIPMNLGSEQCQLGS
ncbi:uncharacterized protein METZ01_LOCUS158622, partial [marine metagenome]